MNSGFIATSTIVIIALVATVVGGGAFGAYKYNEAMKEKEALQQEIIEQKNNEIERLKLEQVTQESTTTNPSLSENISSSEEISENELQEDAFDSKQKPEIIETVRTVVEYVPIEMPAPEPAPEPVMVNEVEDDEQDSVSNEVSPSNDVIFDVLAVRQTAFPDGYGGVYGGYEIEILVTAPEGSDVYVPQTTTNTIGASRIGFSYTVVGEKFAGVEDSKVSCSVKRDNNCRIKAGQSSDIKTTIWLFPDSESNGNYALTFDEIYYLVGSEWKTYSIDRTTSKINLMF